MNDMFFASYLIGLREGLEGTLVVSILVAILVKSQRRDRLPQVWLGVASAVGLSVLFGVLLTYIWKNLDTFTQRELFEAVTSVTAVGFVTWMIFWMRRAARGISGELRTKLTDAVEVGPVAVLVVAFLAVAREGLETAMFFFAAAQGATATLAPLGGIIGGVVSSIVIGILLYLGAVRVNLSRFFTWTGVLLVLVAAGIFKYGIHDFQEAGVLPGLNTLAYDISGVLPPGTWYAELLRGMVNLTPTASVLESVAWAAYAIPVLVLFLLPVRATATPRPAVMAEPSSADAPTPTT